MIVLLFPEFRPRLPINRSVDVSVHMCFEVLCWEAAEWFSSDRFLSPVCFSWGLQYKTDFYKVLE